MSNTDMTQAKTKSNEDLLKELIEHRDSLVQQVETTKEDIDAVRRTIRLHGNGLGTSIAGVSSRDLAHCKSQREALVEIARLNNGIVRVKDAANTLVESGHAKGKLSSARSSIHNLLSKSEHLWKYVEPGTFEYIGVTKSQYRDPEPSTDN